MTSAQAANACAMYAKELRKVDSGDIPLAGIAALRVWMSVMNEPSPGLLSQLLDRIDGAVQTRVDTTGEMTFKVIYEGEDDDRKL